MCFQTPITGQQPGGGSVTSSHPSHPSHREFSQCLDMSSYEGPPSPPLSAASSSAPRSQAGRGAEHMEGGGQELPLLSKHFQPRDPAKWNVEEVYEFICSLPGGHCDIFHLLQQFLNGRVAAQYNSGHQPCFWRNAGCAGFCFSPVVTYLLQSTNLVF